MIPSHHAINVTARALHTMEQKAKRRADTAIVLARMKQRFNLCVRVLTNAEWLAPSHELEVGQ
jgi:hypothetical protein